MTDRELMQQALEALNHVNVQDRVQIITALREGLAQPAKRPWQQIECPVCGELARAEPQRKPWVGLNAKDLTEIPPSCFEGAIWADAKLKEKNT